MQIPIGNSVVGEGTHLITPVLSEGEAGSRHPSTPGLAAFSHPRYYLQIPSELLKDSSMDFFCYGVSLIGGSGQPRDGVPPKTA